MAAADPSAVVGFALDFGLCPAGGGPDRDFRDPAASGRLLGECLKLTLWSRAEVLAVLDAARAEVLAVPVKRAR